MFPMYGNSVSFRRSVIGTFRASLFLLFSALILTDKRSVKAVLAELVGSGMEQATSRISSSTNLAYTEAGIGT